MRLTLRRNTAQSALNNKMTSFVINLVYLLFVITATVVSAVTLMGRDADDVKRVARFKSWMKEVAVWTDSLDWPHDFPASGRGVVATRQVREDEVILRVPIGACMFKQMYLNTPIGPLIEPMDNFYGLIWGLAFERAKGEASKFAPYLDIIPSNYTLTEAWSNEDLHELQDAGMAGDAVVRRQSMHDMFNEGMDVLFKNNISIPEDLRFSTYVWASRAVRTRCFAINETHDHVMVPYADLLNHLETSPTHWHEHDGNYIMYGGPFRRGEEAFGNYRGDYSNRHMVSDYGFMIPTNRFNNEPLYFPAKTLGLEKKQRLIGNRVAVTMYHDMLPLDLTWIYRLASADDKILKSLKFFPETIQRERKACETCLEHMKSWLAQKPTTVAQDYGILGNLRGFSNKKTAVQFRISQKVLYLRMKEFCEMWKKDVLACATSRTVRKLSYARKLYEIVDSYFNI